jgi:N-acyl-D-amino-acid deacylase
MTTRRAFVHWTAAATVSLVAAPSPFDILRRPTSRSIQGADFILRNALVFDGAGSPPRTLDIAIADDRIHAVGTRLSASGARVIDLSSLALAPGLIDIHSHTDLELFVDQKAESKIRQGVTTEVAGQDGGSIGPWRRERARQVAERYRRDFGVELEFSDLGGFFAQLERTPATVNIASMIGHGTIREYVIGAIDRTPTTDELAQMRQLVARAVQQGACGLSSGLEYVPGAFADVDELVTLASELRGTGLPYASHMRNEDDRLFAAVEEALNVGRAANVPVHISHLKAQGRRNWWKAESVLEMLTAAQAAGLDVAYDRYPYVAYSTGLSSLFPVWSRDGGTDAFLGRLNDPTLAPRIEAAVRGKIDGLGSWDAVQITSTGSPEFAWAAGRRLGTLAKERGVDPYALLVEISAGDRSRAGMVGFGMSEENTARFLAHPLGMVCSDGSALATTGPLARGTPHPRNFGTYPRVLGHYCRERNVMPLEVAIHKMSGMPARRLRLTGRGAITPGAFADLVVFDPDTVADRATFEKPHQYPTGIPHVMVNGRFVVRDGEQTGEMPGRVVRPGVG